MALSGRCDEDVLRLLLAFPEGEQSALAAKELCALPGAAVYSLLVSMGRHLDLRGFIYKVRGAAGGRPVGVCRGRICGAGTGKQQRGLQGAGRWPRPLSLSPALGPQVGPRTKGCPGASGHLTALLEVHVLNTEGPTVKDTPRFPARPLLFEAQPGCGNRELGSAGPSCCPLSLRLLLPSSALRALSHQGAKPTSARACPGGAMQTEGTHGTAGLPRGTAEPSLSLGGPRPNHTLSLLRGAGERKRCGLTHVLPCFSLEMLIPAEANRMLHSLSDVISRLGRLLPKASHVLEHLPEFLHSLKITALLDVPDFQQVRL